MKKKATKDKTNKKRIKAFTLIELLAVIIILGILMIIAVPAVTKYINDSRKSSYINSAKNIISGARILANSESLDMVDDNTTYYIPVGYIKTENGQKTPYGEFTEAYVGLIHDATGYKYYWISNDSASQGIKNITKQDNLDIDLIEGDLKDPDIRNSVETTGIEDRTKIRILNMDGTWQDERIAQNNINEDGELEPADVLLAIFLPGEEFNVKLKTLSGDSSPISTSVNNKVEYIKESQTPPTDENKQNQNIISTSDSEVPIYAWYDNGTIYWWSEDRRPNFNENSYLMFTNFRKLKDIQYLNRFKTNLTTNMSYMFGNSVSLETIDVSRFDTSKVTNMSGMFYVNYSWGSNNIIPQLKTIKGLENFDTRNVTNMSNMFTGQAKLTSLDLSSFNTEKVQSMSYMFSNCLALKNINTSSFNTKNVTTMEGMFQHVSAMKIIDVSNFDTSKVTNMAFMFGCGATNEICQLTEIDGIEKFNTSNVTTMRCMFVHQTNIRALDLSSFDTSKVEDTRAMFSGTNLVTIYASPSFNLNNATSTTNMFRKAADSYAGISNSYVLTGGRGTTYSDSHTDKEYARLDDPDNGRPGYFTLKNN